MGYSIGEPMPHASEVLRLMNVGKFAEPYDMTGQHLTVTRRLQSLAFKYEAKCWDRDGEEMGTITAYDEDRPDCFRFHLRKERSYEIYWTTPDKIGTFELTDVDA